jgi:hypothetical protein
VKAIYEEATTVTQLSSYIRGKLFDSRFMCPIIIAVCKIPTHVAHLYFLALDLHSHGIWHADEQFPFGGFEVRNPEVTKDL